MQTHSKRVLTEMEEVSKDGITNKDKKKRREEIKRGDAIRLDKIRDKDTLLYNSFQII